VGIALRNAGPGPATIKSIVFYVDRKPVQDAFEAGKTYGKLSEAELGFYELEPGDTLAVGEKVWLINYRKPKGAKVNQMLRQGPVWLIAEPRCRLPQSHPLVSALPVVSLL